MKLIICCCMLLLFGCSISRWEGKTKTELIHKKGEPDKMDSDDNGEYLYYEIRMAVSKGFALTDRKTNEVLHIQENDTTWSYKVYSVCIHDSIFNTQRIYTHESPQKFTIKNRPFYE